jgi:hypothetical protein
VVDSRGSVTLSPVREKGYASSSNGSSRWWDDPSGEETPELRWPLSVLVYDRMRRQDAQVGSTLRAMTGPIVNTQTRVDGTGCRDEVTLDVAKNFGLPIVGAGDEDFTENLRGRDRFSWTEHKRLALLMLPFGHSFFEQVYRYDEKTGRFRVRKYGPRLPRTISKVNTARDGGLVSIEQYGLGVTDGGSTLPVNRLIAYVLEREGGNWLGQSLLRTAYKNWLLKDRGLRTWATSIDRNGVGIPDYEAAPGETSLEAGQEITSDMRAGDNSGVARPNGSKLQLLGVQGALPDIEKYVAYHDSQISRSALGHFLNLGGQTNGQVGSYNLGSVFADTFHLGLETVDRELLATANAHAVEDLVDINFGPDEPAPRLVDDPIGMSLSELDRVRAATGLSSDAALTKFLQTIPPQEGA